MKPTTREEFKAWVMRKLGEPVININVAQEQVEDRIDEAVYKLYERHYDAVDPFFMLYPVTQEDIDRGYLLMPDDVCAVTDVARMQIYQGTTSLEYQTMIQNIMSFSSTFSMGQNLVYYVTSQSYMTLINRFFNPQREYSFNKVNHKVIMKKGDLVQSSNYEAALLIRGFRILKDVGDEDVDDIGNIWGIRWLGNYAVALVREQWANNVGKFGNIQLLGGVTINGADLLEQAEDAIEKLEQDLMDQYELPVDFFVG